MSKISFYFNQMLCIPRSIDIGWTLSDIVVRHQGVNNIITLYIVPNKK